MANDAPAGPTGPNGWQPSGRLGRQDSWSRPPWRSPMFVVRRPLLAAITLAAGSMLGVFAAVPAWAASPVPPTITANPNNLMVNTDTTLTGRHFAPGETI